MYSPGGGDLERLRNPLLPGHDFGSMDFSAYAPTLWPISGPISSSFGEREDPVLGTGEGEFHPGIDISALQGTPIHATADGTVITAEMVNGYGRMVAIDHGHGVVTRYGHMSGFAVTAGQTVSRGEVVGYVGHTGRTTGNHVHYEVRINGTSRQSAQVSADDARAVWEWIAGRAIAGFAVAKVCATLGRSDRAFQRGFFFVPQRDRKEAQSFPLLWYSNSARTSKCAEIILA